MDGEDFTARNEYYRKARICPHCGNDDKVAESEHPFGGVRVRRYVCLKCGWNWEVEAYREENEGAEAAEEKFSGRPQILKGDIVRVVGEGDNTENCHVVSDVRDTGVYSDYPNYHYNEEIAAVYRFDGRDFKCIWDREEYKLQKWNKALANAAEAARRACVSLEAATAALVNLSKAEKGKARKASK